MTRFTVIDNETGNYPDCEKIALTEEWAKNLIHCDIDTFAITEDGSLILMDDCGNCAYCPADRFIAIFEKQIPKKPLKIDETYNVERQEWDVDYECPSCGNPYADDSYCSCCGQALDWRDDE